MRRCVHTCAFFLLISLCAFSCLFPQSPATQREELVKLLARQGITDRKVLAAIGKVPREVFVEGPYLNHAYENRPLPIGDGQTISQPFVVALMTQALGLKGTERVLEVGTGSGYQAAVLAQIVKTVFTVEIRKDLAEQARERLARLGYKNMHVRVGDGYQGWPEHAPFDAIMVTASAGKIPRPLLDQLAEGGRLIMPVGSAAYSQELTLVTRKDGKLQASVLADVVFVRMIGEVEKK